MQIRVGEVVAAHGLDGGLKVYPASDHHHDWGERLKRVAVDRLGMQVRTVRGVRRAGDLPVLLLEGVTDRTAAESLVGARLYVEADELPQLPAGEFYWHQLLGLRVTAPDGTSLGTVLHVTRAGAHDVIEVGVPEQSWLVPFVKAWVEPSPDGTTLRLTQDPRHAD
jgi:16S rRNA processing protein RimM